MKGKKVLIIDDDAFVLDVVDHAFSSAGVIVITAQSGQERLRKLYAQHPDLVILDIMMPELDGWDVCRQIRLLSDVPIIMVTALNQESDILRGLDNGADDFISKPFSPAVLLSRSRAVLRRLAAHSQHRGTEYQDDYLVVDLNQRKVLVEGNSIKLTPTEFKLLEYLISHLGRVLTFRKILENVWGWEYQDSVEYVHVYIAHLRRKIEVDPRSPNYILSEHGVGYRFERRTVLPK